MNRVDELPAWMRRRLGEWTRADTVAAALAGIQLAVLLPVLALGSLYIDDLRAQGYAVGQPFWSFVLGSNRTHFAPLPRTLDWWQAHHLPLMHAPAVVVSMLIRALFSLACWRLLRRMFGARPATLVPYTLLLFTPALLPATAWYRQSITGLACATAMVWALDAHLRHHLRHHLRRRVLDLVSVAVATAVAVGCYEKGALIPGVLAAATLLLIGRSLRRPASWWRSVRPGLPPILVSAVLVLGFLLAYRSGPYDQGDPGTLSALKVAELARHTVFDSLLPQLFGIGWQLPNPFVYLASPAPSLPWRTASTVLAGLLLVVGVVAWRGPGRVVRAVLFTAVWVGGSVLLVALGRYAELGQLLALDSRLWADLVPVLVFGLSLMVLPWRIGACRTSAAAPPSAAPTFEDAGPPPPPRTGRWTGRGARPLQVVAVTLLIAMLAGSAVSWQRFTRQWWNNPTGDWIAQARLTLAKQPPRPRVIPRALPETVMPLWVQAQFPSDQPLIALLRPDAQFEDADGPAQALSAAGALGSYRAEVLGETPQRGLCVGAPDPTTDWTVPMPNPVFYEPGALIEVALLTQQAGELPVTLILQDGTQVPATRWSGAQLGPGPHTVRMPLPPGTILNAVRFSAPQVPICVVSVKVWRVID